MLSVFGEIARSVDCLNVDVGEETAKGGNSVGEPEGYQAVHDSEDCN